MVKKGLSARAIINGVAGSRGSSMKGILFFLFAVAVCFGYFYFFTDVLRPKEETPGQPDVYTSEVKKPLPERLVQTTATSAEEATTPPPGSASPVEPPVPGTSVTDSGMATGGAPSGQERAQAVPERIKTPKQPQPSVKPAPVPAAKSEKKATVAAGSKKDSAKKSAALPGTAKSTVAASAKTSKKAALPQKSTQMAKPADAKKPVGAYSLVVGSYVLRSSLLADKTKLEKAGLQTHVSSGNIKTATMNRLLVAEAATAAAARQELDKVKKVSKDAFLLRKDGTYAIYAGSYFDAAKAQKEQERLRKQGFVPILKKSEAPVSSYLLSVGSYSSREAALQHVRTLKKMGFEPYPAPRR